MARRCTFRCSARCTADLGALEMASPTIVEATVRDISCGEGVRIVMPANIYGCTLGDQCFVGPFVEIQRGAIIGARTKVQSHAFICELVTIGEDCFVGHGVKFVNDPFRVGGPARGRRELWASTTIGDRVSIGSNATLLPVRVCSDVVVGAGAVVTRDITEPGIYAGNPARRLRGLESKDKS